MNAQRRRNTSRRLARWHRVAGIIAAAFVLLLSVTGLLLNHTSDLDLDKRFVRAHWLLDWYGIGVPRAPISFAVGEHWVSQIGSRVYFDARELGDFGALVGAVKLPHVIAVAAGGKVILLTPAGETVEVLAGEHGVPAGMRAIGSSGDSLVIRGAHGTYVTDAELTRWHRRAVKTVRWTVPQTAPNDLQLQLIEAYRGHGLSAERVVRDIHSGRVLGRYGYWVMDVAALGFLLLAATGLWLWMRRRK